MKDLMKMIVKKKEGAEEMSPEEIKAKMDVIQELLELANESQGKGIAGKLQKVSVMAPDKEKLMEGLSKAKELVQEGPEAMMSEDDSESEESEETPEEPLMEEKPGELEAMTPEDDMEGMSFEEKRRRKMMDKMKEE